MTWYSQILGADNQLSPHDVNRTPAYQAYRKIVGLELMVTTPLTHSQDVESKEFEVTGSAIAYGFLIPNAGDTFIATVDNGRQAIFNVTKSEKATYMKGSNYQIDYKLTAYVDPILVGDLDLKSVQSYQFVKSLLTEGQYPLMDVGTYALYGGLNELYNDLISMYFRDFYSNDRQTLLVPDQVSDTYDHFLTRAMVDIVSSDDNLTLPNIRMPAVEGDAAMVNVTFWDALIRTNKSMLVTGIQRMAIVPTLAFRNLPQLTGIYYTGISQLIYPKDPRTDVDALYGWVESVQMGAYVNDGKLRYSSLERALREQDTAFFTAACPCVAGANGSTQLPAIVPVTTDDYYVFTQGFYGVRSAQMASTLEVITRLAMTQQAFDRETLTAMGTQAFNWPNLERFYYIPVILALIKISLRSN